MEKQKFCPDADTILELLYNTYYEGEIPQQHLQEAIEYYLLR